jgi:hypothetical protein
VHQLVEGERLRPRGVDGDVPVGACAVSTDGGEIVDMDRMHVGVPHSIVRPTWIFGGDGEILANNIAWLLSGSSNPTNDRADIAQSAGKVVIEVLRCVVDAVA